MDERKGHISLIDTISKSESRLLTQVEELKSKLARRSYVTMRKHNEVDHLQSELDKFKKILHEAAYNPEPFIPQSALDALLSSDMTGIVKTIDGNVRCRTAEDELALMKSWNPDYVHEKFVPDPNIDYDDISGIVPDDL